MSTPMPGILPSLTPHYTTVINLSSYLAELLGLPLRQSNTDSSVYANLVQTTYIATNTVRKDLRVSTPMIKMREVIDNAQLKLLSGTRDDNRLNNKISRSNSYRSRLGDRNIITTGYYFATASNDIGKKQGYSGITNKFVNTTVTALQSSEWETLLQQIGVETMLHLLTETSVFVALPNGCFCQMTGRPFTDTLSDSLRRPEPAKRQASSELPANKSSKRRRLNEASSPSFRSAADIDIPRLKIFYSSPACIFDTNHIAVGLSPRHVLNRIYSSFMRKVKHVSEDYHDPDESLCAAQTRHLSKYVFPRQYRLSNVFDPNLTGERMNPDYLDREEEIKKHGTSKTPSRLRKVLPLLDKIKWRHTKCRYKSLRDFSCPSKVPTGEQVNSSVILALMSERRSEIRSQRKTDPNSSIDSFGNSLVPLGLTQAKRSAGNKAKFIEFSCSHIEVYRFLALATKAVIPKVLWGCDANLKLVLKHVQNLVSCRRHETLTLHHILQGFTLSQCEWLKPQHQQCRTSVSDSLKRQEMLEEFLYWYFDSFILSLLKTTFYITESSALRNQVLYFRHDDWKALCAPLVSHLTQATFTKIHNSEVDEVLRQSKLKFSSVRLLPKETGVRPIANLGRKNPALKNYNGAPQSINQILNAAFRILTYEKKSQPGLLGASTFSSNDVYTQIKSLKERLNRASAGNLPKLYFVKVDVQACFDTIEQQKLLEILKHLLSEEEYTTHTYGKVSVSLGRTKREWKKVALPEYQDLHFLDWAAKLADSLRNIIFVDQVKCTTNDRTAILQLLEEHITENLVKIGRDYYRQVIGVPQGSVLSTILCSFFYGDLEKNFIPKFRGNPNSLLLRWTDDYLYITADLDNAREFLNMMNEGHPTYGCFISSEKTLTNFDYGADVMNVTEAKQRFFPWCGYRIDMTHLSVSADYSKYPQHGIANTLNVSRGRRPGLSFTVKMLKLVKQRSHILYSDANFNTEQTVHLNIYQNFLVCAIKMHLYLKIWGINTSSKSNTHFIHHVIDQVIRYCYINIKANSKTKLALHMHARCEVPKTVVTWLGTHAFRTIFAQKEFQYSKLLKRLSFTLFLPQYRRMGKRFRNVVADGLAGISSIVF